MEESLLLVQGGEMHRLHVYRGGGNMFVDTQAGADGIETP